MHVQARREARDEIAALKVAAEADKAAALKAAAEEAAEQLRAANRLAAEGLARAEEDKNFAVRVAPQHGSREAGTECQVQLIA